VANAALTKALTLVGGACNPYNNSCTACQKALASTSAIDVV